MDSNPKHQTNRNTEVSALVCISWCSAWCRTALHEEKKVTVFLSQNLWLLPARAIIANPGYEILIYYGIASLCEQDGEPQGTGNDAADGVQNPDDRQFHIG